MSRDESTQPDNLEEPDDLEDHAEAAEPESGEAGEPTPHLKVEKDGDGRTRLYERGPAGEWVPVEDPHVSDDPDVDAIGQLDYEEVEAILEDEDDPRYELAKEYFKRSSERMMRSLRPITDQYSALWKNLIGESSASDFVKRATAEREPILPASLRESSRLLEVPEVPDVELPHNPMYDVLEEQRAMNGAIVETNGHLAAMLAQARKDAESSAARAVEERRRGRWALGAAWVAAAAAVVVPIILDLV